MSSHKRPQNSVRMNKASILHKPPKPPKPLNPKLSKAVGSVAVITSAAAADSRVAAVRAVLDEIGQVECPLRVLGHGLGFWVLGLGFRGLGCRV